MATAGPNYPGTVASGGEAGGYPAWTSPSNASANDGTYATVSVMGVPQSLIASNFGFAIPAEATIDGILVEIDRKADWADLIYDYNFAPNGLRLRKAGSPAGTAKSPSIVYWGTTDAVSSYGGAADLWGTTWTPSDINNSGFGYGHSVYQSSEGEELICYVDYIRITVYYTVGAAGGPQFRSQPARTQSILAR